MNTHKQNDNGIGLLKIAGVYVLLVVGILLLPGNLPPMMVRENGPIEILSAAGHFFFCLYFLYLHYIRAIKTSIAPFFFIFLLGLREFDFHQRFTTMGIFKTKFFVSYEVPIMEKLIVTIIILLGLTYGIIYLRRTLPTFKQNLLSRRPYALSIASAFGCIFLSKFLDGNAEIFEPLLPMVENLALFSVTLEECLELFIPIFFIRALHQYRQEGVRRQDESF